MRRTFERRLQAIPETLPAPIGCLGRVLVTLILPWHDCARAAALDSTVRRAGGGVWHQKNRAAGPVPHTAIETAAHGTTSGWHGWVSGWNLHLVTTAAAVWIPLAARLTPANAADTAEAPALIRALPPDRRCLLDAVHSLDSDLATGGAARGIILVTSHNTKGHPYPHTDPGVAVRRILPTTRSLASENFNEMTSSRASSLAMRPCRPPACDAPLRAGRHCRLSTGGTLPIPARRGFAHRSESFHQGGLIYDQASINSANFQEIISAVTDESGNIKLGTYLADSVFNASFAKRSMREDDVLYGANHGSDRRRP